MDIGIIPIGMQGDKFIYQAADDDAVRFGKRFIGEVMAASVKVKERRDVIEHNRFHAIIDRAVQTLSMYEITDNRSRELAHDDLLVKLKYATGFVTFVEKISGERIAIPRSESYDSDAIQEEIYAFYNASYAVLCTLLNCTMGQLFDF